MPLEAGRRLGPYEIVSPLGAGGMGEVYRARDTRLGRTVALKILPSHLAESPELRQRFEREARAISALDHPHICVLHDVGQQDGVSFLVMEHLDGETLARRLEKGALPIDQVMRYGVEMADALDRAHRKGIVHRDLKPGNVMLTRSGTKLLDFGLAKLSSMGSVVDGSLPDLATVTGQAPLTGPGSFLGTLPYMAPEQLEGRETDARTDIFALGSVLYEMATGQRAFPGKSQASVVAAILGPGPAPVSRVRPVMPAAFDRTVATCLAKDPDDRWQSAHDLAAELRWIAAGGSEPSGSGTGKARRRRETAAWIAAAAGAVLALSALVFGLASGRHGTSALTARFQFSLPADTRFTWYEKPVVSPDGTRVTFAAYAEGQSHLYVRDLGSLETRQVPGAEGAAFPFWSPDGTQIGFVVGGVLKRIDAGGGLAQPICAISALSGASWYRETLMNRGFRGATWSPSGVIAYSSEGGLFRTTAGGAEPVPLGAAADGKTGRFWPQFLPDGRRYLYLSQAAQAEERAIWVATLDSDEGRQLVASDHEAAYSSSGHLVFVKEGALMAQPFDAEALVLAGSAIVLAEPVAVAKPPYLGAAYSVSANGVITWRTGLVPEVGQLTWFDRAGKAVGVLGPPGDYGSPVLSPDGQSLAVERVDPRTRTRDLWIIALAQGNERRLTFDPGNDINAAWSPDASWIAFSSDRTGGVRDLYRKRADGGASDELLLASPHHKHVEEYSPDGRFLLISSWQPPGGLFRLSLSAGEPPRLVPLMDGNHWRFAPGGRWFAYEDESEVYVRELRADGTVGPGRWQVSGTGGLDPRWRGDGQELFYFSGNTLMAVTVALDRTSFEAGAPRPLFKVRLPPQPRSSRYVVSRDGQRFLVNHLLDQPSEAIEVLVNGLPPRP